MGAASHAQTYVVKVLLKYAADVIIISNEALLCHIIYHTYTVQVDIRWIR